MSFKDKEIQKLERGTVLVLVWRYKKCAAASSVNSTASRFRTIMLEVLNMGRFLSNEPTI